MIDAEQTDEYCFNCKSNRLIFDYKDQYYNFWICVKCGYEFSTERFDGEETEEE